jgi:hypothetical protein
MAEDKKPVSISPEQLQEVLDRLRAVESDRDMLLQVADKKQLSIFYQRNRGKIPSKVMLRTMDDKVIISWRTVTDDVYQEPGTMRWVEKQIIELTFEDKSKKEINLKDYVRLYKQVEATIKAKTANEETGDLVLKVVRTDNLKEYDIDVRFIN